MEPTPGLYTDIRVEEEAPPEGDAIFMSCDAYGSPGALNTYVLQSLGLPITTLPSRDELARGYAFVQWQWTTLIFVVTIDESGDTAETLHRNLQNALRDPILRKASRLWIPLMGTGDGGLSLDESETITRDSLGATGWSRKPVTVILSAPKASSAPSDPRDGEDDRRAVNASVFYASPSQWDAEWLNTLTPGRILFWIKNGASHSQRLQRGHTVVLLAGRKRSLSDGRSGAILALGVLAAGSDRMFMDEQSRRWPVLITHVFLPHQLPRDEVEAEAGRLTSGAGGVHALDGNQTSALSRLLRMFEVPRIPFDETFVEEELAAGQSVEDALRAYANIREVPGSNAASAGTEPPPAASPTFDAQSDYLSDSPAHDVDLLDRGRFAVDLARRLHDIWCRRNGLTPAGVKATGKSRGGKSVAPDDTFIVHVDAPWGGGKTTFANFVAKALNPRGVRLHADHFLSGYATADGKPGAPTHAPSVDGVFLGDFDPTRWEPHPRAGRRPWIIACSNAWRHQDVEPPWWQIYLDVARAVRKATLSDVWRHITIAFSLRAGGRDRLRAIFGAFWAIGRWGTAIAVGVLYRLLNPRLLKHLILTLAASGALWFSLSFVPWKAWNNGVVDPAKIKTTIELALLGLGLLGGGLASLGALITQSLAPDLDFSGETKRVGVGDPIARFRFTFRLMLALGRRPVLLIVDDLDRCPPKQVVELLRGFQTILQSPRMFVMILGDRHWIENAHSTWHTDMKDLRLGTETNLGARFVEKVFQLSFVLPAMSDASRDRYTRAQLGETPSTVAAAREPAAKSEIERAVEEALNSNAPAADRERSVHGLIERARQEQVDVAAVEALAASRITAESVGDVEITRRSERLLAGLAPLLPNNPRQIKRVINAFPLFAAVGAEFFGYSAPGPLSTVDDTLRWRQLALWVALSIEWPKTWRRLAIQPRLLDAAFAPEGERQAALNALTADQNEEAVAHIHAYVESLRNDPALHRLLGAYPPPSEFSAASALFAKTRVDTAAVWQFNRIIWEAGFDFGETAPVV